MRVYKERQYLIFDYEDGRTVKYDFATKQAIGLRGQPVKDLRSQLKGYSLKEIIDCCDDKQYGKFLRFLKDSYDRDITNIGTILLQVPSHARFEQLFSAGFDDIVDYRFKYSINDIPKGLVKLCREHDIKLSNVLLENYKTNPDAYLLAFNLEYMSLTDADITRILINTTSLKEHYGTRNWEYNYRTIPSFNYLLSRGYNAKALLNYIDHCKTYEAIEDMDFLFRELVDYVRMMSDLSTKYDKYPRHLLTTHRIASRNYTRLKQEFNEEKFKQRINKDYECTFGEYRFIYPESTQEIKDEASQQSNCVASYIDRVIDGQCHIMFLRKKDNPDKSLVTIEIVDNKIVQAKRRFNDPVTFEDQEAIDKWNKKYAKKEKLTA
jgi:hypothetical protein